VAALGRQIAEQAAAKGEALPQANTERAKFFEEMRKRAALESADKK
jgi:hypothetical protein